MIVHSKPSLDQSDYAEVLRVLESGLIAQGSEVRKFEDSMASTVGVKYAAAVNSGTAALHLALAALGVGRGDEVVIPSYACSALLYAVRRLDAVPIPADIDPETYNIDPSDLRHKLTKKTKCIIVPHMFGLPADMEPILSSGIPVVEDCALAVGSRYGKKPAGSMGVLSVFSFYATKMLTTGEGGMVLSNDSALIETVKDLREYDGKDYDRTVRYNCKLTDFQAALGISQLKKLPFFIEKRKRIAAVYTQALAGAGLPTPVVPKGRDHVFYRYVIPDISPGCGAWLQEQGIECRKPVFNPLHCQLGLTGFPNSQSAWERSVSIPIYPALKDEEVAYIAAKLHEMKELHR